MSSSGVKQGCTLSPTLSNIYQNDKHDIFNNECDPVELDGISLNLTSWADDLVLLSTSKKGLQNCLERLSDYSEKWQLSVNVLSAKVMVLSAGHSRIDDMKFDNNTLECVSSYKYLELIFSRTGKFTKMEGNRTNKA